jgi:hypothetical protein
MPMVVVPVAIRPPSVGFDVPPSVAVIPTIFPRFVQFVTRMLGLAAVPTVMFDRFHGGDDRPVPYGARIPTHWHGHAVRR